MSRMKRLLFCLSIASILAFGQDDLYAGIAVVPGRVQVVPLSASPVPAILRQSLSRLTLGLRSQGYKRNPLWTHSPLSVAPEVLTKRSNVNLDTLLKVLPEEPAPAQTPLAPEEADRARWDAVRKLKTASSVLNQDPEVFKNLSETELAGVLAEIYEGWEKDAAEPVTPQEEWKTDIARAIEESRLSPSQLDAINEHSSPRGPMRIEDYLASVPLDEGGYILGITGKEGLYRRLSRVTGLTVFNEAYIELFGRIVIDQTDEFLRFITATDQPIAFFVPKEAMFHDEGDNMTRKEFDWFFAHPKAMRNVTFVLGADQLIPDWLKESYANLSGLARDEEIDVHIKELRPDHEVADDSHRLAQRWRHQKKEPTGTPDEVEPRRDKEALVDLFISQIRKAEFVKDRLSRNLTYFVVDKEYYVVSEIERGLFIYLPGTGDVFISNRTEKALYDRVRQGVAAADF